MNSIARHISTVFNRPSLGIGLLNGVDNPYQIQRWRGIRVEVFDGNLEQALTVMQRKMQTSGIERLLKRRQTRHIKNSEKRVLARNSLQRRIQSQELARKLKSILIKKVRGL